MPNSNSKLICFTLLDNGFRRTNSKNWILSWQRSKIKSEEFMGLTYYQKINHFPKSSELGRKDKMNQNIGTFEKKFGKEFRFVPKSYILPQELSLLLSDQDKKKYRKKYYIVKPNASSQGRGIYVTDNLDKVKKKLIQILNKNITNVVVSEYLTDPLLINGLKFDMRIYVLITSYNPLKIYIYEEGLVRFATEKFTLNPSQMKNSFIHLTNYSINKKSDKFQATNEDINNSTFKWTLSKLKSVMRQMDLDPELMTMRIEDLIIKAIISVEPKMFAGMEKNVPYRNNCFEVLGFDVIIDSKLQPWLIEVLIFLI